MSKILAITTHGTDEPTKATMAFVTAVGAIGAKKEVAVALLGEAAILARKEVAAGVKGIDLRKGDRVVAMEALSTDDDFILSVAENAVGKRTPVADYRRQSRGGKGIINLKVSAKTGPVIGAKHVSEQDGLMLITLEGKIIRINVEGVRKSSRSTMGVKLMDLDAEDRLVAVAKLAEREEMDDGDEGGEPSAGEVAEPDEDEPVN